MKISRYASRLKQAMRMLLPHKGEEPCGIKGNLDDGFVLKVPIHRNKTNCYAVKLPDACLQYCDCLDDTFRSPFVLYENETPLKRAHAPISEIETIGRGRYAHWKEYLYFSTPDNSDPNHNGRRYSFRKTAMERQQRGMPFPTKLHVVLTEGCNLTCRICRPEPYKSEFLGRTAWDKISNELFPYVKELRLDGGGELLIHNDLPYFVGKITENNVPYFVSTNGMLMSKENAALLANSPLKAMQFSVDSPDAETLEWIRRGAKFDRLIDGVKNLVAAREHCNGDFTIDFHAALMRRNIRQLPDLVRLAARLGVNGVTTCLCFIHQCFDVEESCFWARDEYGEHFQKAMDVAKEVGIYLLGQPSFTAQPQNIPEKKAEAFSCASPFHVAYIRPNGDVAPCCCLPTQSFGNLKRENFYDIWNSERYQQFRKTYNTDNPLIPFCSDCLASNAMSSCGYKALFGEAHWEKVHTLMTERGIKE